MTPRLHPLLRLVICLFGVGALFVIITAVIVAALRTTTAISGQAVDLTDFFTDNPLVATVLFYPLLLLWLWFCRRAIDGHSFPSLGLRLNGSGRGFVFGAACGALAITLLLGVLWLTGNVRINGPSPEAFESGAVVSAAVLCFFGVLFFAVGFMEELCFRGYAMHNLAAWGGLRFAIAVQAVVFALVHMGNVVTKVPEEGANAASSGAAAPSLLSVLMDTRVAMLNISLIGVFFALSYIKTGSLWFPIGFHAAWNFFLGCVWSLPVSGVGTFRVLDVSVSSNTLLTGGDFGAEGSILLTPLLLVLLWVVWQEADHPQALSDLAESRAAPESHTAPQPSPAVSQTSAPAQAPIPVQATAPAQVATPLEDEYVPSRFRTTMRPKTSAGVPLPLEANTSATNNAPFMRDVTSSVAAATTGAANDAPDAPPEVPIAATDAVFKAASEEASIYQVDVTESAGALAQANPTFGTGTPDNTAPVAAEATSTEPTVSTPPSVEIFLPEPALAQSSISNGASVQEPPLVPPQNVSSPEASSPQATVPSSTPAPATLPSATPPPASPAGKKARPRW